MKSSELSPFQSIAMAKHNGRSKAASFLSDGFLFVAGAMVAFFVVWAFWSFFAPDPSPPFSTSPFSGIKHGSDNTPSLNCGGGGGGGVGSGPNLRRDPPEQTFYDDPELNYTIDAPPVQDWDEKRREWLKQHPSFAAGAEDRIFMVTGSQATPCKNPIGDYLLLKLFKNKVDYCRRHGIDIFYNNVLLQPKMFSFWAKTPTVKAAMLAHPEAEWIWWVDSDAAFTDMDFLPPMDRYENHNLVVHGWPHLVEKQSWTSVNAGVFLIRNCQWAMDFIDTWATMGPQSPEYDKWGKILSATFKDKIFPESDDQSGLVYLLLKEKEKWGNKIYVESEYYFEGYWMEIIGTFDNITDRYAGIEKAAPPALRRRHGEKVSESYARVWEEHLKEAGQGRGSWRRPFITHFTGCQPCSGAHNQMYSGQTCFDAMQRALTFADNQVLRNYGFVHPDIGDPTTVNPIPFDYPASN